MRVVSLVLAVLACTNAFTLTTAPPTMRVAVAATSSADVVMLEGVKKAAPKKAAAKKPAAKKVVKKAVKKSKPIAKGKPFQPDSDPNIIKKIFAMPLIGGGKGVDLPAAYRL